MDLDWDDGLDRLVPFASLLRPWVADAAARVAVPDVVTAGARTALWRSLLDRLAGFVGPAALEAYRAGPRGYDAFVAAGPAALTASFPGAETVAVTLTDQWVTATQELVARVADDLTRVDPGATCVVDVRPRLGDPHRGGHHVASVTTDTGAVRYLKPRPIDPEQVFFALADRSPGLLPDGDRPELWAGAGYGWMAPVRPGPVTAPGEYWRRVGRMLRLLQLCGTTDLHSSNVICTGRQLVPVDLECLSSPELVERHGPDDVPEGRFQRDSAELTGLLPRAWFDGSPVAVEWSGLVGRAGQPNGRFRPRWVDLGTDDVRRERQPLKTPVADNLALAPDGSPVPLDVAAVVAGYEEEADRWSAGTFPGDALAAVSTRVILRPTAEYASHLARLLEPEVLAHADALDRLAADLGPHPDGLRDALGDLVDVALETERAALRRLDIPLFATDGHDLVLDDGTRHPLRAARRGPDRVTERLGRLTDRSWRAAERAVVQVALESAAGPVPVRADRAAAHDPVDAVRRIARELADEAVDLGGGRVGWAEAVPVGASGRLRVALAPSGLYHGAPGIAVFLAAVAATLDDDAAADLARRALVTPAPEVPWLPSGWSGWAWAAAAAGSLLDDADLRRAAVDLVVERLPEDLPPDEPLDLIGGWAGPVAAAAGVARLTGDDVVAERATAAGVALADGVRLRLADEIAARDVLRLGMAHGSTGVLHALDATVALGAGPVAAEGAARLRDLEDERVARRGGIGGRLDQTKRGRVPSRTWCWGVSGYLVGRAGSPAGPGPREALETSFSALADEPVRQGHLCCGRAGHVEGALAARRLGVPGADELLGSLVASLTDGAHGAPFHDATSFSSPSLFRGRAGVGLALLRACVDESLPTPVAP